MLGICLGMQLLFTESEEYGLFKGLNLIPGRVVKFKDSDLLGLPFRIVLSERNLKNQQVEIQERKSGKQELVSFETAIEKEQIIAGSAESVIHYLERYKSNSGCNFLLLSFQWGDLNHEEAVSTMKVVGDEFIE